MTVDQAPYPGPHKEGDRGPAVVAIQGALHTWGAKRILTHPNEAHLRTYNPTGDWLHPTSLQVGHFQSIRGIPVTNTFGPKVHDALAAFYTPTDRAILRELHHHAAVLAWRSDVAMFMDATAGKRDGWYYTEDGSRMQLLGPPPEDPLSALYVHGDCSSTVCSTVEIYAARHGLTTALGSWPTTYSTVGVGTPVMISDLICGDRVHYGADSHMGMFRGQRPGMSGLWVWSFGEEPGPEWRELEYRPIYACRRDIH